MGGPILTPFQRSTYQIIWANSYELIKFDDDHNIEEYIQYGIIIQDFVRDLAEINTIFHLILAFTSLDANIDENLANEMGLHFQNSGILYYRIGGLMPNSGSTKSQKQTSKQQES
ncbi:hypothetical protein RhiirA4_464161 [Rhizophagus irregularis]|uniref:Uncharacterized protein n=1 Tax=Rhizophagus irregularis TaxID=588596 RepID=A0A2I1GPG1_9GLOM|nr:hypothetical protein RhiirA4_464161 [Rhizophagus irregularis]